jgi:hypothetical protein
MLGGPGVPRLQEGCAVGLGAPVTVLDWGDD